MLRVALACVVLASLAACFGPNSDLTEDGLGKPFVTVDFPAEATAGSAEELLVEIDNPGPGDMNAFTVAFANVAVGGTEDSIQPLLRLAPTPEQLGDDQPISPSITSIEPEPLTVGQGGLVFGFGPLPEEEAVSVSFEVVVPEAGGIYANSVQAYDSQVLDRIDAVKLQVEVAD